jgi:hypothetical protein
MSGAEATEGDDRASHSPPPPPASAPRQWLVQVGDGAAGWDVCRVAWRVTNLDALLPDGEQHATFHDALVVGIHIDYANKRLVAQMQVCVGDPDGIDDAARFNAVSLIRREPARPASVMVCGSQPAGRWQTHRPRWVGALR